MAGRFPVSLGEVKRGLTSVRLAGRLQVLPGRPTVVLDGCGHSTRCMLTHERMLPLLFPAPAATR